MNTSHLFLDTCEQLIRQRTPNLFRLYLNPYVVQTCLCLKRYVQDTWHRKTPEKPSYQSFLANGFDEALSGAIKLSRYSADIEKRSQAGLVLDSGNRIGPFASIRMGDATPIEFIPDLTVLDNDALDLGAIPTSEQAFGFIVVVLSEDLELSPHRDSILSFLLSQSALLIVCVDRAALTRLRSSPLSPWRSLVPDIVVFDESFAHNDVPFGAFTARKALYNLWNIPSNSTFHSTTFQPNSVSTLHFMKCLEHDDPSFVAESSDLLKRIDSEPILCKALLGDLYNPFLSETLALLGFDTPNVHTDGHYLIIEGRRVFDGVGGVACSVRGHNPTTYVEELAGQSRRDDYRDAAIDHLNKLTGLDCMLPAVSGACAVENALRIGLTAQYPRKYILALKGGFGGKTLLALTGTSNSFYKSHLGCLYEHVRYIDPFTDTVLDDLKSVFDNYPIALVQLELIQGVGGVRPIPEPVLRYLDSQRKERDYLLFVDEVQTGMYRTGPFSRCEQLGIHPDILTVGKGVSDMMFPFAATLYSAALEAKLKAVSPDFAPSLRRRYDYEFGYKTLLNALQRADKIDLNERVKDSGSLFAKLLSDRLLDCKFVRAVRTFGLLIAIELHVPAWLPRPIAKKIPFLYIYELLSNRSFPLFFGYCQYEPNVLKFTPPLSIATEEIERACDTIGYVLRKPLYKLLSSTLGALAIAGIRDKWQTCKTEHFA
jgi:acetylornithine/succinyldiaminopimelate/putrescine aminotransferase